MVNVECIVEFDQQPDLNLNFSYNGEQQSVGI